MLRNILPAFSDSADDEIVRQGIEKLIADAGLSAEYRSLRQRAGKRSDIELIRRVRSLDLCVDGTLLRERSTSGSSGRLLIPAEAAGVAIDIAALESFCSGLNHRAINAASALAQLGRTHIAGGKKWGAVRQSAVDSRLLRTTLQIGDSGDHRYIHVAALPALLQRIQPDFDALHARFGNDVYILLHSAGVNPRPTPVEFLAFSKGDTRCLLVPAQTGLHSLKALPHWNICSSCFKYSCARVLGDGTREAVFECARSNALSGAKKADVARATPAIVPALSREDVSSGESDSEESDSSGESDDGDGDSEESGSDDDALPIEDDHKSTDSEEAMASSVLLRSPPLMPRAQSFAVIKSNLRVSKFRNHKRQPTEPYLQTCGAQLFVFQPPVNSSSAMWLLARAVSLRSEDYSVVQHSHRLDEYSSLHPVLEANVFHSLLKTGRFKYKSRQLQAFIKRVLELEDRKYRKFVTSGCTVLDRSESAVASTLDGSGLCRSPLGLVRSTHGRMNFLEDYTQ